MSINAYKLKISQLNKEKAEMLSSAIEENRSLTNENESRIKEIENEVLSLQDTITLLEENKISEPKSTKEPENTNSVVDFTEEEIREALKSYITDEMSSEERAYAFPDTVGDKLVKTSDNAVIIPTQIANYFISKLEEHSNVFAEVSKLPPVTGKMTIPRKTRVTSAATRVAEGAAFDAFKKVSFDNVILDQERYCAGMILSQQLLHNAKFNLINHAMDCLAEDHAEGIELEIFKGKGTGNTLGSGFRGLEAHTKFTTVEVNELKATSSVVPFNIMTVVTTLLPKYLINAKWYMSRTMYQRIARSTKDGMSPDEGQFILQNDIVNGKPVVTLFGYPIEITQVLEKGNNSKEYFYFGSMKDTFTMMIKEGFKLKHIFADTEMSARAAHMLLLDIFMDGTIINDQSMVKCEFKPQV